MTVGGVLLGIPLLVAVAWAGRPPPMTLYIREDCESCGQILQTEDELIARLQGEGRLDIVDVTGRITDLPGTPALVDGYQVIVGIGLVEHLRAAEHGRHTS